MKLEFNKRYTTIAVYCALVLFLCIFAVFALIHFGFFWGALKGFISVLLPILIGAILAYVFSPIVTFFEQKIYYRLDKKKKYRLKRVLSVISMFIVILSGLLILVMKVIPAVMRGYADFTIMSGMYLEMLKEWLLGIALEEGHVLSAYFDTFIGYVISLLDSLYGLLGEITPDVASLAGALVSMLGDVILGIILSIYFLFSKEKIIAQFKKMIRAFLSRRKFAAFRRSVHVTNDKFGGFLKGQLADALIVGVLAYICLYIIGVPYYPLVSVIVGIASFIPAIGILMGTILGAVIIFLANPLSTLWFILFMVALYFVNKTMIRPKVIRITVDASSIFMLAAIVITTGLVGFWGLILGVPIFAVLYAFLHSSINKRLARRGLAVDTYDYYATQAGKELYIERESKKTRRTRMRGYGNTDDGRDIFVVYDNDTDDETELFVPEEKEKNVKKPSNQDFPQ